MAGPVVGVVTNPNSRKNRLNPQRYEQMRATIGDLGLVRRTQDVTAIADVVREFLDAGVRYFVADGGDGAFHWLMNTTWQVLGKQATATWPAILPTNAGTIDFVGRKAGVIGGCDQLLPELARHLRMGLELEVVPLPTFDLRGVYGPNADFPGKHFEKLGFAAALCGISQRFFDKFYAHDRQDGPGIAFLVAKILSSQAVRTPLLRWVPLPVGWRYFGEPVFEPMPADVWLDGAQLPIGQYRDLDIGAIDINIKNMFRFFPLAHTGEHLHVQCGDLGALDVLRNLPRMSGGQPMQIANYVTRQARHVKVVPREGKTLDPVIDGELYWGLAQCEVAIGPKVPVVRLQARD